LTMALATACEEEEAATATPTTRATPTVTATPTAPITPTAEATQSPVPTPTATATPVPSPTAAVTPTAVAAPMQPGDFADYPGAIAGYLTVGSGSPSCLAELVAAWDMPTAVPGWAEEPSSVDCAAGDLDGDDEDEYLLRITNPIVSDIWPDADVLIFDRGPAGYELAFQSSETLGPSPPWQPVILGIRDFNGDGKLEASFTADSCGAHTCWTSVYILAWDGQQYVDIIDEEVGVPWAQDIRFVDVEGDGIAAAGLRLDGFGERIARLLAHHVDPVPMPLADALAEGRLEVQRSSRSRSERGQDDRDEQCSLPGAHQVSSSGASSCSRTGRRRSGTGARNRSAIARGDPS